MKSFDIIVDKRHVQGDLIVANLLVRNDIAAYSWLVLDSELLHNIIAEKAVSPDRKSGGIVLGVNADETVTKYEVVNAYPVELDASAEFQVLFPLDLEAHGVALQQKLQEVSQKMERASSAFSFGADDMLLIAPLKSVGQVDDSIVLNASASEVKHSIIDGDSGQCGVISGAVLTDPLATYYESGSTTTVIGADVHSLSYLLHLRLIQSDISIGVNSVYFDLYRSLGKLSAAFAIGLDASFLVGYFIDAKTGMELSADAELLSGKFENVESGVVLSCTGAAMLRRMRLLSDINAMGELGEIDDMTLEDMYYEDIEE